MFNVEPESREVYEKDLQKLWYNSGYNMDSMHKRLQKDCTKGFDKAYDGSMAIYHFEDFSVVISPNGYYFVVEIE